MRKALAVVLGLFVLFGAGMVAFEAQAGMKCYTYHNSQVTDLGPEHGFACAGTGNGCAECYDEIVVRP